MEKDFSPKIQVDTLRVVSLAIIANNLVLRSGQSRVTGEKHRCSLESAAANVRHRTVLCLACSQSVAGFGPFWAADANEKHLSIA